VIICGIDPGASGGVAFIDTDTLGGWGELIDTTDARTLATYIAAHEVAAVGVEVPTGRPPQTGGWKQISQQWRAIGCAEGVVLALGLPLVRITPASWQKLAFAGRATPKAYLDRKRLALRLARERWPGATHSRAKDSGIADALWIAATTSRHVSGQEE
jgi:hypothetical protein